MSLWDYIHCIWDLLGNDHTKTAAVINVAFSPMSNISLNHVLIFFSMSSLFYYITFAIGIWNSQEWFTTVVYLERKEFSPSIERQSEIVSYLRHHSMRTSPSQFLVQQLSARFFMATAYSLRVSSSSQCSRQIFSKSPTAKHYIGKNLGNLDQTVQQLIF